MDTSVSDVSISDFAESRKVTRKRKRKIAPLNFEQSPLDGTFYSPDRPRAAQNPKGAPAVDALGQTNSWISLDEFGKLPSSRPLFRRRPATSRGENDVITCSRDDCAHPLHVHSRGAVTRQINISDNDSDLLITVDNDMSEQENSNVAEPNNSRYGKPVNISHEVEDKVASGESDSGIGNTDNKHSDLSIDHVTCLTPDHVTCHTPDHVTCHSPEHVTCHSPELESPALQTIGFSQCKSGKTKKRTRQRLHPHSNNLDTFPDPVFISNQHLDKENLRRRVVFESPRTPATNARKSVPKLLETPESGCGNVLVEDTPEHLVGVRMVTRRLRRLLGHTVPDSLKF